GAHFRDGRVQRVAIEIEHATVWKAERLHRLAGGRDVGAAERERRLSQPGDEEEREIELWIGARYRRCHAGTRAALCRCALGRVAHFDLRDVDMEHGLSQ